MHYYTTFGLTLSSPFPIRDFISIPKPKQIEISIKEGDIPLPKKETRLFLRIQGYRKIWGTEEDITLYWRNICAARVEKGSKVTIMGVSKKPRPGFIRAVIIGPVMGMLLYQRLGHMLFHSSVMGASDGSYALSFMAKKGGGKSSQAAALLNHDYKLVSDDLIAVKNNTIPPMVQPGFPGLKLWEYSAKKLVKNEDDIPKIGPNGDYDKRSMNDMEFSESPLPLKAVFILEFDNRYKTPEIIPLSEKEAFMELLPHWYGAQFKGQLFPILGYGRHFSECSSLTKSVPVVKLIRSKNLSRIDETVLAIENYLDSAPVGDKNDQT